MKNTLFLLFIIGAVHASAQKVEPKVNYQMTSLKIKEVKLRKDTISLRTDAGMTSEEVFQFVESNQSQLTGVNQVEVINKAGKLKDYYAVHIKTKKPSVVPKLPFQGSFYLGYTTNQFKFRFNYAKNFGISGILATNALRPEDSTSYRVAPALTTDFIPFLLPKMRGSIDIGPMFGSEIRFATIMVRTTVERNITNHWSFGFNYMLVASKKPLSEFGAGLSFHF